MTKKSEIRKQQEKIAQEHWEELKELLNISDDHDYNKAVEGFNKAKKDEDI